MSTIGDVIARARGPLQDETAPYRYSDPALLTYANEAMQMAIDLRPDLIFGAYGTTWADKVVGDSFPFASKYEAPVADYIVFRANAIDDEAGIAARAVAFRQLFEGSLT